MDIYEALETDHREIQHILEQLMTLSDANSMERTRLLARLRDELVPHSRAEEAIFYNSLRSLDHTKDLALHGYKDHIQAEALLRLLQVEDVTGMQWMDTIIKLRDALENHIAEEEAMMFDAARENFTQEEAEMFGHAFEELKHKIRDESFFENTLQMVANMMPPRFSQLFRGSQTPHI